MQNGAVQFTTESYQLGLNEPITDSLEGHSRCTLAPRSNNHFCVIDLLFVRQNILYVM